MASAETINLDENGLVTEESENKKIFDCKPFDKQWYGSDIILNVKDAVFHVHSVILGMASPVFKAMLNGNFKEGNEKVISLPNKGKENILEMLKLVYPVPHQISDESDCQELLSLAKEYDIRKIFYLVDDYFNHVVQENFDPEEILLNLELCEKFSLERALRHHIEYYSSSKRFVNFIGDWSNIGLKTKLNIILNRNCDISTRESMEKDLYKKYLPNVVEHFDYSEPWENSDVKILCNGGKLHAHTDVLLIASEKFEEIFDRRSYHGVIDISEYDKEVVVALLNIIYPSSFTLQDLQSQKPMLEIQVEGLRIVRRQETKQLKQLLELAKKFKIKRVFFLVDDFLSLYVNLVGEESYVPVVNIDFLVYSEKYDLDRSYKKLRQRLKNLSSNTLEYCVPWERISWKTKYFLFANTQMVREMAKRLPNYIRNINENV